MIRDQEAGEARRDSALVRALARRRGRECELAAGELLGRHFDPVVEGLMRVQKWSRAEAEDLAAETVVRLLEHPERFNAQAGSLRTYLAVIARNLGRDQMRRESRLRVVPLAPLREFLSAGIEPDAWSRRPRLRALVVRELGDLTSAIQVAVALRLEGLSTEEIAREIGGTPGTVRTRLSRAVRALRERLQHSAESLQ